MFSLEYSVMSNATLFFLLQTKSGTKYKSACTFLCEGVEFVSYVVSRWDHTHFCPLTSLQMPWHFHFLNLTFYLME